MNLELFKYFLYFGQDLKKTFKMYVHHSQH